MEQIKQVKCVIGLNAELTENAIYFARKWDDRYVVFNNFKNEKSYPISYFEELDNKETKKVKIIKAKLPTYWYADKIGQIFEVKHYNIDNYEVIDNTDYVILKNDCEVIPDYVSDSTTAIDPIHYQLPIEPKDFIIKNQLGFCEGNVIKYICRYKQKNGVEDLKKAKQYIDFLIDEIETKSNR